MEAHEAHEFIPEDAHQAESRFKRRSAIAISVFAAILAISTLGGSNASKEMVANNIAASNLWGFFQAKNIRQTAYRIAKDDLELRLPAATAEQAAVMQGRIGEYKATIDRYETEPATGEGKKELSARALALEAARDHAARQDPYFDVSDALLQIAIVLCSVSIIAISATLFWASMAIAGLGALLMLNGFTLAVALPILG